MSISLTIISVLTNNLTMKLSLLSIYLWNYLFIYLNLCIMYLICWGWTYSQRNGRDGRTARRIVERRHPQPSHQTPLSKISKIKESSYWFISLIVNLRFIILCQVLTKTRCFIFEENSLTLKLAYFCSRHLINLN